MCKAVKCIIARVLFVSHVLMSCANPYIGSGPKQQLLIEKPIQQHDQDGSVMYEEVSGKQEAPDMVDLIEAADNSKLVGATSTGLAYVSPVEGCSSGAGLKPISQETATYKVIPLLHLPIIPTKTGIIQPENMYIGQESSHTQLSTNQPEQHSRELSIGSTQSLTPTSDIKIAPSLQALVPAPGKGVFHRPVDFIKIMEKDLTTSNHVQLHSQPQTVKRPIFLEPDSTNSPILQPSKGKDGIYHSLPNHAKQYPTYHDQRSLQERQSRARAKRLAPNSGSEKLVKVDDVADQGKKQAAEAVLPRAWPSVDINNCALQSSYCSPMPTAQQLSDFTLQARRQGYYQLARVQAGPQRYGYLPGQQDSIQPILKTREGHQINLVQAQGYWHGIVQENCPPGFSRTLTLPVLYPQGPYATNAGAHPRTIETLLKHSADVQRRALHVVLPEKSLQKQGFVYTGPAMGLLGGGFWRAFGKALAISAVVAVAAFAIASCPAAATSIAIIGTKSTIAVGAGVFSAFAGLATLFVLTANNIIHRNRVMSEVNDLVGKEKRFPGIMQQVIEGIQADPKSYKTREKFLARLEELQSKTEADIEKLKEYRDAEEYNKNFLDSDFPDIAKYIAASQTTLASINQKIQEANTLFRNQAWADFEKLKKQAADNTDQQVKALDTAIAGITAPGGLSSAEDELGKMAVLLNSHITMYQPWKDEPALFPADQEEIATYIQGEEAALAELVCTKQLIDYGRKNQKKLDSIQAIAVISTRTTGIPPIPETIVAVIEDGLVPLVHYALTAHKLSLQSVDKQGNTPLHIAVRANKTKIVKLLLTKAGKKDGKKLKSAKNKAGKTPLDLAKNATIKKLLQ